MQYIPKNSNNSSSFFTTSNCCLFFVPHINCNNSVCMMDGLNVPTVCKCNRKFEFYLTDFEVSSSSCSSLNY